MEEGSGMEEGGRSELAGLLEEEGTVGHAAFHCHSIPQGLGEHFQT